MYFRLRSKIRLNSTVKYKDAQVFYSHTNGGKTLVFLHGFLEESSMWENFAKQLKKHHKVICIDLLGHGKTSCVGYVHSMEEQAEMVMCVLRKENVNSCIVIGHSMGGYVALALAEKYPQVVSGLVLFHSTALADDDEKKKDRERVIDIVKRDSRTYVKVALPTLFAETRIGKYATELNAIIQIAQEFPKQGIIANIRGIMQRKDRTEVLRTGAFRKLILHGAKDPVVSTKSVIKQAKLSSNIRLEILEEIGHMGHIESPLQCERIIADFCAEIYD